MGYRNKRGVVGHNCNQHNQGNSVDLLVQPGKMEDAEDLSLDNSLVWIILLEENGRAGEFESFGVPSRRNL